jgi:hypothetical protein
MIKVTTASGSVYHFDLDAKTWARVGEPRYEGAHALRNKAGVFYTISDVVIGQNIVFEGPGFDSDLSVRYIKTSPVVRIDQA